ncbi:hypothetical protein H6P81_000202 [Aristolochia fimbriata]|uniref:Uncharacterized protein n=1 Tax=Aristolochia fimbriata TaxID=158543 RepID=A0AAV7F4W0_ARIFI|nr:hypothetical protein H6P81_000202 [Aristolochia fimbriata]
MTEALRCDSASYFAFLEELSSCRPENQRGFFFQLDDKGKPIVRKFPAVIDAGNWTNVGFCNELLFYRSRNQWEGEPCVCYVVNMALLQVMPIPDHPHVVHNDDGDDYVIVVLGLSWFDSSDLWKFVAVLQSTKPSTTFRDDGLLKIGTFDPKTGAWKTEPALLSDEFEHYFESDSYLFYLNSSPAYHGEALYWVHGWNAKAPKKSPRAALYRWNKTVDDEDTHSRPLSLVKLCLKTNLFRLIRMPLTTDKRNVGLLFKSEKEGCLAYCHLCPSEGLRVWVLLEDDDDDDDHMGSTTFWKQTYCVLAQAINFCHVEFRRKVYIDSLGYWKLKRLEEGSVFHGGDEVDLEEYIKGGICMTDFVSVLAFKEEIHTILFKVNGCWDTVVCFDFEEKKVVSHFRCEEYFPEREVARMWIKKQRAPYRFPYHLPWWARSGSSDRNPGSTSDQNPGSSDQNPGSLLWDFDVGVYNENVFDNEYGSFKFVLTYPIANIATTPPVIPAAASSICEREEYYFITKNIRSIDREKQEKKKKGTDILQIKNGHRAYRGGSAAEELELAMHRLKLHLEHPDVVLEVGDAAETAMHGVARSSTPPPRTRGC